MDDGSIASFLRLASGANLSSPGTDGLQIALSIALTVFLVLLNGFFVATEFSLVKVRSTRIKELADSGNASAKQVATALRQLDAYLSATQFGITLASLGLGWVGEPVVSHLLTLLIFKPLHLQVEGTQLAWISYAVAFVVITFAHIIYGELVPKWMAIQRAESVALRVAYPMRVFAWLFRPFIWIVRGAANLSLRAVGIKPGDGHETAHSEEELRMIIAASGSDNGGTLRETQAELLDNVFDFGHRLARQVMTHRTEILALDVDDPLVENIRVAETGGHTRYPVMHGDIDTIIGFVHTKDLFAFHHANPQGDLRQIVRDVLLVPETIRVDLLLKQMQRRRQHVAVLVDEYGGTLGLVTLYDLLEELVGELPDEFEPTEAEWITRASEHAWQVDGRVPMSDLEEALDREVPCEEACDTVGGYAFWAFGRIPAAGDTTTHDGITLKVLEMDGRRVSRVEITAPPVHTETDDEDVAVVHGR